LFLLLVQPQEATAEPLVFIDVVGAPGDGEEALATALGERLLAEGLALAGAPTPNAYEIQGTVRIAPGAGATQTIRIDWTVFGPDGDQVGIVTQERNVPKGSLDRKWGAGAKAAANAAAQDIVKLIPR
jgi:hypothetical protein